MLLEGAMRGRDLYRLARLPLAFCTVVFKFLPRSLARMLWPVLDIFPGLAGIGLRYALAQRLAANVGASVFFGPRVTVVAWDQLHIGDHVSIHRDCYLDASGGIWIGSEVSIAHSCSLISFNHTWSDPNLPIRSNPLRYAPINIDDDVWIGCGVRILAGTTIGKRTVVGAGSVVSGIFEGQSLIGGVPARVIKEL